MYATDFMVIHVEDVDSTSRFKDSCMSVTTEVGSVGIPQLGRFGVYMGFTWGKSWRKYFFRVSRSH